MTAPKSILLTGVNGFLGNYLTSALLNAGYEVFGIGKGICRLAIEDKHFHYYSLDLTDSPKLAELFTILAPGIVIHAAANSKPDDCEDNQDAAYAVNVRTTQTLLELAVTMQSRFIYISTDFVFDGQKGLYKESDQTNPINYYGKTKQLSEQLVAQYPFANAIIRTVLVYGKPLAGRQNILSLVHQKLQNGEPFRLVNDQFRTPTFVKDLVWGIVQIVQQNKTGVWHLSGDQPLMSPYQMGIALAETFHFDASLLIPVNHTTFQETALRPRTTGLDIQKAKTELGFRPTPFAKAMREMFIFSS
ncbi:MAG: SDR family oxidoreductase [Chitinophagaceae bacterium]